MKNQHASLVAVALIILQLVSENAIAAENGKPPGKAAPQSSAPAMLSVSQDGLAAASERIRQTGLQIKADIQEVREARLKRAALEAKQEAERKKEAERARQQATNDAAQFAIVKDKQHQALETAQAQARREAAEQEQKAELERQVALAAQRAKEEEAAKVLEAREKAAIALKKARESSAPRFAEGL